MTKFSLLFPTFMGASLMFGTTYLIKYGINILQDPLSNVLMSITTVVNTEEYINVLLPSVSYGLFCNIKNFINGYYSTVTTKNVIEDESNKNTVNDIEGKTVSVNETSENIQSNLKELETTNTSAAIENTTVKNVKVEKGKQKAIEDITDEKEDNLVGTITKPSNIREKEISPTKIIRFLLKSLIIVRVLPYIKSYEEPVSYKDTQMEILKPISTSNTPISSNPFMAPLSFHPAAATSLGITGAKIKLEQAVQDNVPHLSGKVFVLSNLLKLKSDYIVVAENRAENLQKSLIKIEEEYVQLGSKYSQLQVNFQEKSKFLDASLLYRLLQFQYNSFSNTVAKLGMFFSTTIDILHNTSLNTIVGLSIYGITQFTTNFYTRKLATGIVSTLYSTVFNRITKILCTAIIKYTSYVGVATTVLVFFTSFVLSGGVLLILKH